MSFSREQQRRNGIRTGIACTVTPWLVVPVADIAIDNIGAPAWLIDAKHRKLNRVVDA
jgi:hypothetical protein